MNCEHDGCLHVGVLFGWAVSMCSSCGDPALSYLIAHETQPCLRLLLDAMARQADPLFRRTPESRTAVPETQAVSRIPAFAGMTSLERTGCHAGFVGNQVVVWLSRRRRASVRSLHGLLSSRGRPRRRWQAVRRRMTNAVRWNSLDFPELFCAPCRRNYFGYSFPPTFVTSCEPALALQAFTGASIAGAQPGPPVDK